MGKSVGVGVGKRSSTQEVYPVQGKGVCTSAWVGFVSRGLFYLIGCAYASEEALFGPREAPPGRNGQDRRVLGMSSEKKGVVETEALEG